MDSDQEEQFKQQSEQQKKKHMADIADLLRNQPRQSVLFTQDLKLSPFEQFKRRRKRKLEVIDEMKEIEMDQEDFNNQKQKLIDEMVKFEKMDKYAPVNKSIIQQHHQQAIRNETHLVRRQIEKYQQKSSDFTNTDFKFTQNNSEIQQFLVQQDAQENKGTKEGNKIKDLFTHKFDKIVESQEPEEEVFNKRRDVHHYTRQAVVNLEKNNPNQLIEFTANDYKYLQKTKQKQLKDVAEDIQQAKTKEHKDQLQLSQELKEKWTKVRRKIRMIGKMKMVFDEVKLYGTSFRVESSEKRSEVISELETILFQGINMIEKNSTRKQNSNINSQFYSFLVGCLIHPESNIKFFWTFVLAFLFFYTAFITPIRLTFVDEATPAWTTIEYFIDGLFFIDIILNFNQAYYTETGELITDRKKITLNYIKTWFILDILAIFPFQYLTPQDDGDSQNFSGIEDYFKLTKLPRLYRLIRVARIIKMFKKAKHNKYAEKIEDYFNINAGLLRVIVFFGTVIICVHIMGCFWYFSAKIQNFEPSTWVYENGYIDKDKFTIYIAAIYWSVATISTVGFGDIRAYNDLERLLSIIWMIFGAGFYSFTVGSLANILAALDTKHAHLINKITVTDEFCHESGLSKEIRDKIRKALDYAAMKNIFSKKERDEFLSEIPIHLRYKVAQQMYDGLRTKVPFFRNKEELFIAHFVPLLQPLHVSIGEVIFQRGQHPNLLYFLISGRVNMVIGMHQVTFKTYVSGSYFGDLEIFDNSPRLHSARAETECDMLTINQSEFIRILSFFPDYFHQVRKQQLEKLKRENEAVMKMQQIANLSYKSKFWDKSRQLNLYQAVKERKELEWQPDGSSDQEQEYSQKSKNSSRSKGSKFSRRSIRSKTKNWEILRKKLAEKASLGMMPVEYRHSLIPTHEKNEEEKDDKSILLYSENLSVPSHARRDQKYIQVKVSQCKDEEEERKQHEIINQPELTTFSQKYLRLPKQNKHLDKSEMKVSKPFDEKEQELNLLKLALEDIKYQLEKQRQSKKVMVSMETQTDPIIMFEIWDHEKNDLIKNSTLNSSMEKMANDVIKNSRKDIKQEQDHEETVIANPMDSDDENKKEQKEDDENKEEEGEEEKVNKSEQQQILVENEEYEQEQVVKENEEEKEDKEISIFRKLKNSSSNSNKELQDEMNEQQENPDQQEDLSKEQQRILNQSKKEDQNKIQQPPPQKLQKQVGQRIIQFNLIQDKSKPIQKKLNEIINTPKLEQQDSSGSEFSF